MKRKMAREKSRLFLLFIWGFPLLIGCVLSLPTMSLGPDSETINLYLYQFTFGLRTPDLIHPFFHLISYGVGYEPYRPLTYAGYALDFLLFGNEVFWYRLENLMMFLLIVWGLMRVARKLGMSEWGIFVSAMFLVLHPAHQFMMISIFPRTDFGVALLIVAIVNLVLKNHPHSKFDLPLLLAYGVFLLGIFWKENMLSIAILILFLDLVLRWTKGTLFMRVLLHLPFYLISFLGIFIQYNMTGSLGYTMGTSDIWNLFTNLPMRSLPYFEPLWAIPILLTQTLFNAPIFINNALIGLIITIIVFLIGPNAKSRFSLMAMLIILAPYLLIWSSYMHIFPALLGLSLWSGFFVEGFSNLKNRLLRFIPLLVFCPVLLMWTDVYKNDFLTVYTYCSKNQQMVHYIARKYPKPPKDVNFVITNWKDQIQAKAINKKANISEMNLRIIYNRKDIYVTVINPLETIKTYRGKPNIIITLPNYILPDKK
jgi:hypothetical protein